jgi:hypothetical protein
MVFHTIRLTIRTTYPRLTRSEMLPITRPCSVMVAISRSWTGARLAWCTASAQTIATTVNHRPARMPSPSWIVVSMTKPNCTESPLA